MSIEHRQVHKSMVKRYQIEWCRLCYMMHSTILFYSLSNIFLIILKSKWKLNTYKQISLSILVPFVLSYSMITKHWGMPMAGNSIPDPVKKVYFRTWWSEGIENATQKISLFIYFVIHYRLLIHNGCTESNCITKK